MIGSEYKTCRGCNDLFKPKRRDAIFCSVKCRKAHEKRLKRDEKNNHVAVLGADNVKTPPKHTGVNPAWKQHGPHPEGQFIHELCGLKLAYLLAGGGIYCPFCQTYGESRSRWPK